jgi:hypothetical protein
MAEHMIGPERELGANLFQKSPVQNASNRMIGSGMPSSQRKMERITFSS